MKERTNEVKWKKWKGRMKKWNEEKEIRLVNMNK